MALIAPAGIITFTRDQHIAATTATATATAATTTAVPAG